MLPKAARLERSEVAEVVARGQRFGNTALGLRFLLVRTGPKRPKFAIIVPAKQIPLAVSRHQVKRRVRASLAALTPRLVPGLFLVVFCGALTKGWTTDELTEKIRRLLTEAKLLV